MPGDRARAARPRPPADHDVLARRRRPVHHAALGDHEGSAAPAGATSACTACRSSMRATTGLHWQIHKDAAADWRDGAGRMEVAVALGTDPITTYSGSAPLPKHVDELMLAGFLRGKPVELVQCKTVDLRGARQRRDRDRGLLRARRAARRGAVRRPHRVLHAAGALPGAPRDRDDDAARTRSTRRSWSARRPWRTSGSARRPSASSCPRSARRCPRSWTTTCPSRASSTTAASSRSGRRFPGHARKVMHAIWGLGLLSLTKGVIVVVDEHVDVHDYAQVVWQLGANVDPARDIVLSVRAARPARPRADAPVARRQDRHRRDGQVGVRGLRTASWPEVSRMSEEVQARVDERWAEPRDPARRGRAHAGGLAPSQRRGRLRRSR